MKIQGKTALVTGANRGLGRSIVAALLARGARRVYATARRQELLRELVALAPDRVVTLALDVTSEASVRAAAERAGDVTLLLNNAGVLASFSLSASTLADIERDMAVNFYGVLATARAFAPILERHRPGALINVLSVAALAGMPKLGGYSASKAAAFSLTQSLRSELAPRGISVHGVFPGPIDTDMVRGFEMPKTSPEQVARAMLDGIEADAPYILPDPAALSFHAEWSHDPTALERTFAAL
jgi:NAD(P)-dependent dehydrogenase (short-subunit alcohol dehydrogenase family)